MTTLSDRSGARPRLALAAATIVHLRGALDLATCHPVRERLLHALHGSTNLLVLDLSEVSFCDAAGLGVLVGVRLQARSRGIVLGLAAPRPHVAKVLRITGLDRAFLMYGTIPATTARTESGAAAPNRPLRLR